MKSNRLTAALALSDRDLLTRIVALAGTERETTADLVAHLVALELRPSLYAAQGFGTLFAYCTEGLHLSEDAAWNRVEAARACRDFPVVLDLLASGSLTLTAVRTLRKHLTKKNHEAVLARAKHQKKTQIEVLVAELAPKPDVVASVRKVPVPQRRARKPISSCPPETPPPVTAPALDTGLETESQTDAPSGPGDHRDAGAPLPTPLPIPRPAPHALVQALAPERYRVQFTIGQQTHDKLRRLQALLRREVPNGDAGLIFEQFIDVLLAKVERDKLGKPATPRKARTVRWSAEARSAGGDDETCFRSGTENTQPLEGATGMERRKAPRRHTPNAVTRAVWFRDGAQCAFVADNGYRCTEHSFLEVHHIHPYALDGRPSVGNLSLRCRRHNQYEAELVFGAPKVVRREEGG